MKGLEKLERARSLCLIVILVCSALQCLSFLVIVHYSWWHWHRSFPLTEEFLITDLVLLGVMGGATFWRRRALRERARERSALLSVAKDEREGLAWLRAFRLAFFVLLLVQLASKVPLMIWWAPWEVPYQSALTLSAAVAVSVGAFLYYSREARHD